MKFFADNIAWHKANLHTHTTMSDGKKTPEESIEIYKAAGYDILAITDHRKSCKTVEEKDFILLGSVECNINPYIGEGNEECYHIIGLGMPEDYVQMLPVSGTQPQALIDELHAAGGFVVLAHPAWSLNTSEDILALKGLDGVEIYNTFSGFPRNADRADSSVILDPVFNRGMLLPLLASDDTHRYIYEHCRAATMIQTDDFTVAGILKAIKDGKSYATTGPRFRQIEIEGNRVHIECSPCIGACQLTNHPVMKHSPVFTEEGTAESFDLEIPDRTQFVRVMIMDAEGRRAWSNPVRP